MSAISVDYINPVITGLEDAFSTMLNCKVERTGLGFEENNQAIYPVSGIIGLSGKARGTLVLSMEESVALKAASTMLMTEMSIVDDDVMDAVGELTNMVCGTAKAKLAEYSLSMSLPNVIYGKECRLHFPQGSHQILIPFKCEWGALALQVGFTFPTAK